MLRRLLPGLALILVVSACGGPDIQSSPEPVTSPTVAPVGGPVTFHVRLGAGQRLTIGNPEPDNCPGLNIRVLAGTSRIVNLVAYHSGCVADSKAVNGRHGVYRTTADIPADLRAKAVTVRTPLGEATVFDQPYDVYTNTHRAYIEPVAVITLDHPSDPAYQTLVAYSDSGRLGRDGLIAFVRDQLAA
jgi:hypothetical protein